MAGNRISSALADRRGVAGVEFALVAPVLIILAMGVVEVSQLVRASMKLSHATSMLAKAVAQQTAVTAGRTGTLGDICTGAGLVMMPFASSTMSAAIASVSTTSSGTTQRDWESDTSCPVTATAIGASPAVALASSLVPSSGDSALVIRVSYSYVPALSYVLQGTYTLNQTVFVRPRANTTVLCSNC